MPCSLSATISPGPTSSRPERLEQSKICSSRFRVLGSQFAFAALESRSAMSGAAVFGMWGAVAYSLLVQLAPQPAGSIVYWSAIAALLLWGSTLCWRRMRLPLSTAAMAIPAVASAMVAVLAAAGHIFPMLPLVWWMALGACMMAPAVLFMIEARVNRDKWQQWKSHVERASAWDAIRGRHIPVLHTSATPTKAQ